MSSSSLMESEQFWKVVEYLLELDSKTDIGQICKELSLSKKQLNSFISFMRDINCEFGYDSSEQTLTPPEDKATIKFEFTILEWLKFQAHFPFLGEAKDKPFHADISKKLAQIENYNYQYDIYTPISLLEDLTDQDFQVVDENYATSVSGITAFLEEVILEEKNISIYFADNTKVNVYPHRIVHLDGELSLICESITDNCLTNIPIDTIINCNEYDGEWERVFSKLEINDFISSLRAITDNEIRLVLKVYCRDRFENTPAHQHFGNPCIITNPNGDHIWAASIEPNNNVFEWLSELGADVEILDPISFKKQFLKYCEEKLKKIA